MSNVTFQLLGQNINLDPTQLLDLGHADQDLHLITQEIVNLRAPLHALQDGKLVSLALNGIAPKWSNLVGSPATFSLTPTASFTITLQSSGPLLKYFTDFEQTDTNSQATIDPAPGKVYLIVEADFGITGELSGSGTIPTGVGVFKLTGDATAGTTFKVQCFKAFDLTEGAGNAIVAALRGFTLPLHNSSATNLGNGDALYYEFDGNLKVGFGASFGYSTSIGSYSLSGINQGLNSVKQAVNLTSPGATLGTQAALAINANFARKFHCVLQRTGDVATLHLFKGEKSDCTESLTVSAGVSNVSDPSITFDPGQLATLISAKLPSTAAAGVQLAAAQTASLQTAASAYITQANNWLKSLAQSVNDNGQISLSVQFEQADTRASTFGWQFNVNGPNFQRAWDLAMSGDFVAAYALGQDTVTLLDGSGFETTFKRNTQVKLSLFGLLSNTTLNCYYGATTVTFRSGLFCFETNAGRMRLVQSGDGKFSSTMYLDCLATNNSGTNAVNSADLTLHGIVSCTGEPNQLDNFGGLLDAIGLELGSVAGAEVNRLGKLFDKNASLSNSKGEGLVHLIYTMASLKRLDFDAYSQPGKKQAPRLHRRDQVNFDAFSDAFETLPSSAQSVINGAVNPAQYDSFKSWEFFNCYANGLTIGLDGPPDSQMTDRRHSGNIFHESAIPCALTLGQQTSLTNSLSGPVSADLVTFYEAGRLYMNLCDDVKTAATVLSAPEFDFPTAVNQLKNIAQRDLNAEYAPQVMLALLKSTQATSVQVVSSTTDQDFGTGSVIIQVQ